MKLPFDPAHPLTPELKKNPLLWKEAAIELCSKHGIPMTQFTAFSAGGSLVAAVSDGAVIKLIQPPFLCDWEAEQWALQRFPSTHPDLPVKIPCLLAAEKLDDGWSYLIMSRVPGVQMDEVWPQLSAENRRHIMHQIGQLMAFVHQHSRLKAGDDKHWESFIETQAQNCSKQQQSKGSPEWLLKDLPHYLAARGNEDNKAMVLLTGEYTPFNLLVEKKSERWELTGMVDFADAFAGKAEYDLIGPGVFLAAGDPTLIDALLSGYGVSKEKRTPQFRRRLMTLHLLHRFSNLRRQIALANWETSARSLEELEKLLWPFEAKSK